MAPSSYSNHFYRKYNTDSLISDLNVIIIYIRHYFPISFFFSENNLKIKSSSAKYQRA